MACRVQGAGCEVPRPAAAGAGAGPDRFCAAPARPPAQRGRGSVSVQPPSRHHPQCPHPDQPRVTVSSEVQPSVQ